MSSQIPPEARPSKPMSSRLMTMKFMQRAVASSPSVSQWQARTSAAPPSKRQKLSAAPSSTATSPSDLQLLQIALAADEEKRGKAIERLAEEAGETNWILSTVNGDGEHGLGGLRVANAGYSEIDQEPSRQIMAGRRSFGNFNRELEIKDIHRARGCQDGVVNESSSSGEIDFGASGKDGEEEGHPNGIRVPHRASREETIRSVSGKGNQRKQQRRAEKAEIAHLADTRRSKVANVKRLSSVSVGSVGKGKAGISGSLDMECYLCGEKGHAKRECPQKGKRKNEDWYSGATKRTKASSDS